MTATNLYWFKADQPDETPDDPVLNHRMAMINALLAASFRLLEADDPAYHKINILATLAFDGFLEDYPERVDHDPFIDYLTINSALNSQARNLTVGGAISRFQNCQAGEES